MISQSWLANVQQMTSDRELLDEQITKELYKMRAALKQGGVVERGPLRIVRHGRKLEIY